MSPAHCHAEQSRNTLLFAACAKQVSTNAQVNVVMSEKALIKHLQKQLASLENELRIVKSASSPGDSSSLLREKELLIEKVMKQTFKLEYMSINIVSMPLYFMQYSLTSLEDIHMCIFIRLQVN